MLASGEDPVDRRNVWHLDLEDAHDHHDAGQANIGQSGRLAMTEAAGLGLVCQSLFHRLQSRGEPVNLPCAPGGIVKLALGAQVFLDARRDQRVRIGRQHRRQRAHPCAAMWVRWQQRGRGIGLVEKFKNRQ